MAWNTSFLVQRTKSGLGKAHYFAGLGLPGAKEVGTTDFDSASSAGLEGKALAVIADWTIVIDPFMFMDVANDPSFTDPCLLPIVVESRLLSSTDSSPAYAFVTMGASTTYGFAAYEDKQRTRLILNQDGASIYDEGAPVHVNALADLDADEEQAILALLPKITGIPFDTLHAAEFTVFEFDQAHLQFVHGD